MSKTIESKEEVTTEVKETVDTKSTLKKPTREEIKAKYRAAKLEYTGRLYIDDKYKSPDKILRIDDDTPQKRKELELLGYRVVQADIKVGSGSLRESSNMGSAVHIEQGINISQPGILYEIDKDVYEARMELEIEENESMLDDKIETNKRDDQDGRKKHKNGMYSD